LYKNSFPIFAKNFWQTFVLFESFDMLKDKFSVAWRNGDWPKAPVVAGCAAFSAYLACAFSYPWYYTARIMVDIWP